MDPLQEQFEKDLISKLMFKSSSRVGIENVLLKIFKFFDLHTQGFLVKQDFLKAIAKAGVVLSEQEISDAIFNIYSQDGQTVNYRNFIDTLTKGKDNDVSQNQELQFDNKSQVSSHQGVVGQLAIQEPKMPEQSKLALELLRNKLSLRGSQGLLLFGKALKLSSQNGIIQFVHFSSIVNQQRLEIDQQQQILIFASSDKQENNQVLVDDLLNNIKGVLSQFRLSILRQIYSTFQVSEQGVNLYALVERYNTERHPDVRHMNKRPEELKEDFLAALQTYIQLNQLNDFLTFNNFADFYHFYGFHIHNDELFRSILVSVWDLDQQNSPQKIVKSLPKTPTRQLPTQQSLQQELRQPQYDEISQVSKSQQQPKEQLPSQLQSQNQSPQSRASQSSASSRQVELIIQRIKNRLATRGAKGFISIYRIFKMLDTDKDGLLTLSEFRKAIRDHRIEVTDPEIDIVFSYFDRDQSGYIDLWGMLFVLKGEMNQFRQRIVETVYQKIDKNQRGIVTINECRQNFFVRNHPEVKSGKKQEDEVLQEFVDSLNLLHNINGGFGNENITREEFLEYFSNFSASIPDDKYFENIVTQTFKINQDTSLTSNYAGNRNMFEPDHKKGYLQDHHRYLVQGGTVSQNAPFGTYAEPELPKNDIKSVQQTPTQVYPQSQSFNIFKPLEEVPRIQQRATNNIQQDLPTPNSRSQARSQQDRTPTRQRADGLPILKQKILGRGLNGFISLQKRFRLYDQEGSGAIQSQYFLKALRDWRLDVNEDVLLESLKQFEGEQQVTYDAFIKAIQGTMSLRKFNVVQSAYERLPRNNPQQLVHIDDLRNLYQTKNHPDVVERKKREDDLLNEFILTFEEHHFLFNGQDYLQNPFVSFEEFISYYNNLNAFYEDESLFEQIVNSVWPGGKTRRF